MSKTGTMDHRNRIISEHLIYEIHMLNYSYKNLQTSLPDQAAFIARLFGVAA